MKKKTVVSRYDSSLNELQCFREGRQTLWNYTIRSGVCTWRSYVENSACFYLQTTAFVWFLFVLQWSFSCNLPSGGGVAMAPKTQPKGQQSERTVEFLIENNQYDDKRGNNTCQDVGVCGR